MQGKKRGFTISNNQAATLITALVVLQLLTIWAFMQIPAPAKRSGFAVGQVSGTVQGEPPSNYYFNATAANGVYQGTPAYNLNQGQNVTLEGNESDGNGNSGLSSSTCYWVATGYSTSNSVSFSTCNATDCQYTCSLTLSSSTPSGYYNVTANITNSAGSYSQLTKTIYVFPFTVTTPTPSAQAVASVGSVSGSGPYVYVLRVLPPGTTVPQSTPFPTPPALNATPSPLPESFGLELNAPGFINKCEVKAIEVAVKNNNDAAKAVTLDFEGTKMQLQLAPLESKQLSFKVQAPPLQDAAGKTFLVQASLYYNGMVVAQQAKEIKLVAEGFDSCFTTAPLQQYDIIAGRKSVAQVTLEVAGAGEGLTAEIEVLKGGNEVFFDIGDLSGGSFATTFPVFEKGDYQVQTRVRKGFDIVQQKVEKLTVG